MNFKNQEKPLEVLKTLAEKGKHSVIIEGPSGCGKTYLARQYMKMLGADDFISVTPKVSELKETINDVMLMSNSIVICVENIDTGVVASAYTLLKFMEEPRSNVYIVLTCMNSNRIPDTLISRSMMVSVPSPTDVDLDLYAENEFPDTSDRVKNSRLYNCCMSFTDVKEVMSMTDEQRLYFENFNDLKVFNDTVASIAWKLGHYSNNSSIESNVLIRYIMDVNRNNKHVVNCCRQCMDQLDRKNMARYLVLQKLAFDLKYCE